MIAGMTPDFRLDYGRSLPKKGRIVAVNRSKADLKLNSDFFWKPTLAACADPGEFLLALGAVCTHQDGQFDGWCTELKEQEVVKEQANQKKMSEPAVGRLAAQGQRLLNPLRLCQDLDDVMSDDTILVGDGGDFVGAAANVLRPRGPLCWLDPGAFGTLGVGGGFALGAKLCRPDADVVLIWGDGSSGYSLAEFDTFKRHNVPILALIGNDACWTQIEREQKHILGDDVACPLDYCAYEDVARGYGGDGVVVKDPKEDVQKCLLQALEATRRGVPMVVNAHIGSSDFRDGSISV